MANVEINSSSFTGDANLQAYYRFESGADTTDSSSNSNTLTHINTPSNTTGKFGNGMDYESGSSQGSKKDNPTGLDGMTSASLVAWIKPESIETASNTRDMIASYGTRAGLGEQVIQIMLFGNGSTCKIRGLIGYTDPGSTALVGNTSITVGKWYHVALTYDGSNVRLYLNGKEDVTATALSGKTLNTPGTSHDSLFVGFMGITSETDYGDYFDGIIDDVAFFNRALTEAEINEIYHDSPQNGSWSPPYEIQSDNTKVSGSSNLTNFPALISDSNLSAAVYAGLQSDGKDLRITTDSAGTTEVPFEIVNLDTASSTAEIWAKVPTLSYNTATSLFIWYGNTSAIPYDANAPFGSQKVWTGQKARYHAETLTFDSTSNGYTLTNNNSVVNATGKIGSSADFGDQSGSKKSLSRTDAMAIDLTGNWTIGFWVNVNTAPATNEHQYIVDIRSTTGTARYQLIKYRDNSGTKQVELDSGGTTTQINQTFTTSTWYHYVVNKNSSTMTVYINGSSIGTGSFGTTANADNNTRIGTALDGSTNPAKVIVDEVFFTTQNLSADWIATEYNNQNDPGAFWSEIGSPSPSASESASPSASPSPSSSPSASESRSPSASESSSPSSSPSSSESRSPSLSPSASESRSPSASPSPSSSPSASESPSPSSSISASESRSPSSSESRSPSASPSPSSSPSSSESPSPSSSISSSPSPSVGSSPSSSPSASESRSPSASPSPSSSESASESSSPSSSESSSPSPSPSSSESPSPSSSISATPSPSPSSSESRSPSSSQSPSSSESASESSSISASVSLSPSASESASPSSSISASPSPAQYADKYDESVGNTYIDKYKNWYT